MIKEVVEYPNPQLALAALPVDFDKVECITLLKLIQNMSDTMIFNKGVGLAANQIGVDLSICIVDDKCGNRLTLINPVIFNKYLPYQASEGCLSSPGKFYKLTRCQFINVEYQDIEGISHAIPASGLLAEIIQHEVDHLNGLLINRGMLISN